ncbi:5'-methylthioadenosine nucleosidase [Fistulifera solaris]|uniref:5'-methylthioadenosine nucleosidase n=1 Tax=Fistulifera solaris TaxID=1519565 RepID=A0A1Z5JNL8_FISSO|nr:5'-methylthioadenosine nucleosidase [Fistulifera solaris]|eukprot:GAX15348.1 5'-methylthioadenosine nucleosidase [Fistulifera solaris]
MISFSLQRLSIAFLFVFVTSFALNTGATSIPKTMPVKNVIVAIAMEAEAAPFIQHLQLKLVADFFPSNTPFQAYQGPHGDCTVTVITNGKDTVHETGVDNVGTVPAALATFLALQKLPDTDILINAGTCGGFRRKGAEIGNVFVVTGVAHHDRRIPIPDYVPYGIGKLDTSRHGDFTTAEVLALELEYKLGVCTTGNSLDKTEEDDKHMLANDAAVKDMEAAAIAWSCKLFDTPFLGLKVVTDIVDGEHPTQDEFLANLLAASQSLQVALPRVLDHICHVGVVKEQAMEEL